MPEPYGSLFEMLDKRLENIENCQNDLKIDMAVIKSNHAALIADTLIVKQCLYGNGRQGLLTTVAIIKRESAILASGIGVVASSIVTLVMGYLKGR